MINPSSALRVVSYLMAAVFAFSAVVQYNDPDPIRWMAIYGAAAISSGLFALNRLSWKIPATIAGIAVLWALVKIPELQASGFRHMFDEFQMLDTGVEQAREFSGLLVVALWMGLLAVSVYRKEPEGAENDYRSVNL